MSNTAQRFVAILVSTLLFSLWPRLELPTAMVVWVTLIPWLSTLDRERSMKAGLMSAWLMSAGFTVAIFAWFATATATYVGISPLLSLALLVAAAPLLQPQFLVFAAVRYLLRTRGRGEIVVVVASACGWVATEWLSPRLFGDTLGQELYPFAALRQGADLAGTAGLTFVVLLVNDCLLSAARISQTSVRLALRPIIAALTIVGLLGAYGTVRLQQLSRATSHKQPLTAVLVQANLGSYDLLRSRMGSFGAVRYILDSHIQLSDEALAKAVSQADVELIIWPETVYPTTFGQPKSPEGGAFDQDIINFVTRSNVPLLFGTYDRDADNEYISAVLQHPQRQGRNRHDVYRKRRLFPLTEATPSSLDRPKLRKQLPWLGTWRPGQGPPIVTLRRRNGADLRIAPLICRDAVDVRLAVEAARNGADLLTVLSNDGWFAESAGARLHLVVSAFRSIETRLPQLRATNSGISAVVDPGGGIQAVSSTNKEAVLMGKIEPGRRGETLTTLWGDWFGPLAGLITVVVVIAALRRTNA